MIIDRGRGSGSGSDSDSDSDSIAFGEVWWACWVNLWDLKFEI